MGTLVLFLLFILFLPVLFLLGYFAVIAVGLEKLGIPPEAAFFLFLAFLLGSAVNIPLTKEIVYSEERRFFGFWKKTTAKTQGVALNLGGAVFPVLISFFLLYQVWREGFEIGPIFTATILMIIVSKILARVVPGKGISLPALIPPVFAALFALILAPEFAVPCAFISGVLGTIIGADILNLQKVRERGAFLSIGGAGVFDGIFLVGIVSVFLAGL